MISRNGRYPLYNTQNRFILKRMFVGDILTLILISLGVCVLIFSAVSTRTILSMVATSQYQRHWLILLLLMIFFVVGYMGALLMVLTDQRSFLVTLTGMIFFFGALFVYIVVYVGSLTIQELLTTQDELVKARDRALEHSQLKTELLARVTHELRTPLHSILGYTEMLSNGIYGSLETKQQKTVNRITVNAERLVSHINHLLHQAKLEANELNISLNPMAPRDLAEYVELIAGPLVDQKGLDFFVHIDKSLPEMMLGDLQNLQEVITNIVGNAIKFTDRGQVSVSLILFDAMHWAIQVEDTGLGIPADRLSAVFEPFKQGDGSITRDYGGTGLGLAIAKQVTEMMGGELKVESKMGEGSCFTIILPLFLVEAEGEVA